MKRKMETRLTKRRRSRTSYIVQGIILIALAVLLTASIVPRFATHAELSQSGFEVTAIVTDIREVWMRGDLFRPTTRDVFVTYQFNNLIYPNRRLNIQHQGTFIGERISIYVDPQNPNRITPADRNRLPGVFRPVIFSVLLAAGGIVSIIKKPRREE